MDYNANYQSCLSKFLLVGEYDRNTRDTYQICRDEVESRIQKADQQPRATVFLRQTLHEDTNLGFGNENSTDASEMLDDLEREGKIGPQKYSYFSKIMNKIDPRLMEIVARAQRKLRELQKVLLRHLKNMMKELEGSKELEQCSHFGKRRRYNRNVSTMAQCAVGKTVGRNDDDNSETLSDEEALTRDEIISNMSSSLSENMYGKLEESLEAMKSVSLLIGVIGASAVGKSSFINNMLGLDDGDEGAAEIGVGDTTQEPKVYSNPRNKRLEFSDLPGFGTPSFETSDEYLETIGAERHDFFLIFYCTTISTGDVWIMKKLLALGKKFALVRTRADDLVRMKGKTLQQRIEDVKAKSRQNLEKCKIKDQVETFVISNLHPDIGEFNELFDYIQKNLPDIKREAIVLHVNSKTDQIIARKEKLLIDRAWKAAACMGITTGLPIPGLDIAINLVVIIDELHCYLKSFGLTDEILKKFPEEKRKQLKTTFEIQKRGLKNYVLLYIAKAPVIVSAHLCEEAIEILLPVIGSVITGTTAFVLYFNFLRHMIKKLAADAKTLRKLHVESVV